MKSLNSASSYFLTGFPSGCSDNCLSHMPREEAPFILLEVSECGDSCFEGQLLSFLKAPPFVVCLLVPEKLSCSDGLSMLGRVTIKKQLQNEEQTEEREMRCI